MPKMSDNNAFLTISGATLAYGLATVLFPENAHAYLDPGSMTMVLQVLVGAITGIVMFGKTGWARIKGLFQRSAVKKNDQP